eukprot:CAMPEP_0174294800 /NCGR_PEP_ID=MMETSP0809-20121228/42642_1 /TAXON_ID=73025 ORGANISM="Eutreptiella gymnastica-like, Strain CCMP1594" /NCGR_SAMPLE_ID=MMETSP0809 /ASSEMBLY_ACC=CAM_ASM_000658 /LENGTH=60 /DNA_ID=CAMNT_0015396507 /DNA_START=351 /DNA_END=533 /DNA_ORIENTATION=-
MSEGPKARSQSMLRSGWQPFCTGSQEAIAIQALPQRIPVLSLGCPWGVPRAGPPLAVHLH